MKNERLLLRDASSECPLLLLTRRPLQWLKPCYSISLFSGLISEYLGLRSSTPPTWDRTRFQQTREREASGKGMLKSQVCHSRISLSFTFHSIQQGHIIRLNGLSSWMSGS